MSQAVSHPVMHRHELRLPVKLLTYAVWVGAGMLFWHAGYAALSPRDPDMSLLLSSGRALLGFPVLAVVAAVTAGLATLILRRWLCDAGTFAVAVGLAALSVRGGTVEYLLLQAADAPDRHATGLALRFALELPAWALLLAIAAAVTMIFSRKEEGTDSRSGPEGPIPAMLDMPRLAQWLGASPSAERSGVHEGIRHAAVVAVISAALMIVFSLDLVRRPVTPGQVLFVTAASAWIGTYFAFKKYPVRSALWAISAALVVALVGYLIAALGSGRADLPVNIPPSPFLRALPIQAAAAGAGGALLGFWFVFDAARLAPPAAGTGRTGKPGPGKRRS